MYVILVVVLSAFIWLTAEAPSTEVPSTSLESDILFTFARVWKQHEQGTLSTYQN